jgi:hypothetical protein
MTLNTPAIKNRIHELYVISRLAKKRARRTQEPVAIRKVLYGDGVITYESIDWSRVHELADEATALCMVRNPKHASNLGYLALERIAKRVVSGFKSGVDVVIHHADRAHLRELIIERMSERYESESKAA